jgi:hypothetical protein
LQELLFLKFFYVNLVFRHPELLRNLSDFGIYVTAGKREKLDTSMLLKVFWNEDASVVKTAVFPGCSSLSAQAYSSLTEIQKFITLRPFAISGSVNNRWKAEKLLYICPVYAPTGFCA